MKIRSGFVSNSSSSSFVIGFNMNEPCPHCGRKDPDIISLIENASDRNDDNNVEVLGFDKVMEYLEGNAYPYGVPEIDDVRSYHVTHPNDTVAIVNISYHDETLRKVLYDSKSVHIIVENGE